MTAPTTARDGRLRLAVLGAGPGGYPAAFLAAERGMDVTLVDPEEHPGGVYLYRGCIPSKALLHVARLLAEARAAADFGVRFGKPEVHLDALREWKTQVVAKLTCGVADIGRARRPPRARLQALHERAQPACLARG